VSAFKPGRKKKKKRRRTAAPRVQVPRVCAPALKGRTHRTVLCRSGVLSAHQYEEAPSVLAEGGRCRQVALFHMQEWKKRWQDGRTHVDHAARYDNFRLTQDGIRPLLTTPPVAFATMAAV
jgi:hypothetical protein